MSTARWRHQTSDVPLTSVQVFHAGISGMDVQLGSQVLWVESLGHFEDLVAMVMLGFHNLPPRRTVQARTDNLSLADVSGSCYQAADE